MKKLLSIAIISILPFAANADYTYNYINTPDNVPANGTVTVAHDGPYQIATITNDDSGHIASTAYVKGAYNDAIAAINTLNDRLLPSSGMSISGVFLSDEISEAIENVINSDETAGNYDDTFLSAGGVLAAIQDVATPSCRTFRRRRARISDSHRRIR